MHRDFALNIRAATRRLGPYLGRTFTGKPDLAYLDTQTPILQPEREAYCPSFVNTAGAIIAMHSFVYHISVTQFSFLL